MKLGNSILVRFAVRNTSFGRLGSQMNTNGAIVVLLAALLVTESFAANTKDSAQTEGRELAQQFLALKPESGFTNIGKLAIRGPKKQRREVNYQCRVIVTETNWTSYYSARHGTNVLPGFSVEHRDGAASRYFDDRTNLLTATQIAASFAGSDFSLADLGLEFFHWTYQCVVKWEMKRSFGCKVLESRNSESNAGGYSRVVSWIHTETGGLIQAEAYDAQGKLLKEFRPTEFEKVNGRHELKEMEIENVQAGTRTTLVFEL
jgi:hypothetical protein